MPGLPLKICPVATAEPQTTSSIGRIQTRIMVTRLSIGRNAPRTRPLTWVFAGRRGGLRLPMCSDQGCT